MRYNFNLFDLWPYILITVIFFFCFISKAKNKSKIIYFILFVFTIFRFDVGWDYSAYVAEINKGTDYLINSRYELLSKAIFILSSTLKFFPLTFIIFGWLTLLLVHKSIIKNSNKPVLSWLVFYSLPLFFFASLSTLRQSLATVFILYSYTFLKENKNIKFFTTIAIASLFHSSGILGLLLWLIYKFPMNKTANVIMLIISFAFPIYFNDLLLVWAEKITGSSSFFSSYVWYVENESEGTTMLQYLYYFFGIFNLIFYKRISRLNFENRNYLNIVTIGIVIFNLLSFSPIAATRISAFFLIFLIYIIPNYPLLFKKHKEIVQFILIILLIAITFIYLWIYIDAYENGITSKISFIPYKFWFINY